MQQPKIVLFPKTLIIGKSLEMSLTNNLTGSLWQSFMPRRKEIRNTISQDLYSIQVYPENSLGKGFDPNTIFTKWAGCPVKDAIHIPENMDVLTIPEGKYAIFEHKGPASEFAKTFNYIFQEWLTSSGFMVDYRPQFEVMGEKYLGLNNTESIEEVYIPIK